MRRQYFQCDMQVSAEVVEQTDPYEPAVQGTVPKRDSENMKNF